MYEWTGRERLSLTLLDNKTLHFKCILSYAGFEPQHKNIMVTYLVCFRTYVRMSCEIQ